MSIRFVKGHGTQNDFILIDDPDGVLRITPEQVARLCDRRQGLGADGLIRVVRTRAVAAEPGAGIPATALAEVSAADAPEWFMDYRNADGGLAQMCGNGVRVFAAHLAARGWVDLPDGGEFTIGTRAGVKSVHRIGDAYGVDLGPWRVIGGARAIRDGADCAVAVPPLADLPDQARLAGLPGLSVNVGNPHVVVALPTLEALASLDLATTPGVEPGVAEGVNVEFIVPVHDQNGAAASGEGHLVMRVSERGVGETRSCGTGAVAAVIAARAWAGPDAPVHWTVDVPGGRLRIEFPPGAPLDQGLSARLSGPAVLVAGGDLMPGQLEEPGPGQAPGRTAGELAGVSGSGAETLSTR